ncbi:MAG: OmpA family protein [Sandaracinaceae bacterium]
MRRLQLIVIGMSLLTACGGGDDASGSDTGSATTTSGGGESAGAEQGGETEGTANAGNGGDTFQLNDSDTAGEAHGEHPSEIEATRTHAAMRLFIVDPNTGPIEGIVVKLTDPNGRPYYTNESDSAGYAEVLVPAGQRYAIEYLSLGRRNATANVNVPEGPNQDIRLTMRHRRRLPMPRAPEPTPEEPEPEPEARGFVLDGVLFDSGSANIQESSFPRIDEVVEYLTYMTSARIQVAGHTDNVGNPRRNQSLSEQRAQAVRTYIVEHGIDGSRVEAVGYGDQRPVASNDTDEGRAQNRRIEAVELE